MAGAGKIPEGFTKEELEELTEEELAGLMDDSVVDEGNEGDDAPGDDDQSGTADPPPPTPEETEALRLAAEEAARVAGDPPPPAPATPPAVAPATPAAAAAPAAVEEPARPPSALPAYQVPANAQQQLADLKTQMRDINVKFDNGELTATERHDQIEALQDQRDSLKEQISKATLSYDSLVNGWVKGSVPAFIKDNPQYAAGQPLHRVLDDKVKELQGSDEYASDPFNPAILAKAHAAIDADLRKSLGLPATPPKPATPPPGKKTSELPPNIGNLPNAEILDDEGGEFAVLDRMADDDPNGYQNALEKLERSNLVKYEEYMRR